MMFKKLATLLTFAAGSNAFFLRSPNDALIVFGDSISDNGNLYALTEGAEPKSDSGSFSNYKTWAHMVSKAKRLKEVNMAYGYSTALKDNFFDVQQANFQVPKLANQVNLLNHFDRLKCSAHVSGECTYVIASGTNDLFVAFADPTITETELGAIAGEVVAEIVAQAQIILAQEGTQKLVIASGFPAQISPYTEKVLTSFKEKVAALSGGFSLAIKQAVGQLAEGFKEDNVIFWDLNEALAPMTQESDYAAEECFDGEGNQLCAVPSLSYWWDQVHLSSRGHLYLTASFIETAGL